MRFELYIWKAFPHQHSYFDIANYDPLKPFHFHIPENSDFRLPIDKNIFGENVNVSVQTQANSSLTNMHVMKKTKYDYVGFSGYINEILRGIHSLDTSFSKVVTEYFYLTIGKDTLNMPGYQTIKLYSFNHQLKTASFEYIVRTYRFIELQKVVKINPTSFVIFAVIDPKLSGTYQTGVYSFKAYKASEYKKRGDFAKQPGEWYIEFTEYPLGSVFQGVSNAVLSMKDHRNYDLVVLPESVLGQGVVLQLLILSFYPLEVIPNLGPNLPTLSYEELFGMINDLYDQKILSFRVVAKKSTCIDILNFSQNRGRKFVWLGCVSPTKSESRNRVQKKNEKDNDFYIFKFYVKIQIDPKIQLLNAFREPPELTGRYVESCYTNDMVLFADMIDYGIFMKSRDKDFKNIMKPDFMYQNMTKEEIAGSSYTLTCIEDSMYVYLQIYNSKKNKYIFYQMQSFEGWSNSRIKDINMLEEIGPVRPLVTSLSSLSFYIPQTSEMVVYTNLHRTESEPAAPTDLNIEYKTVVAMTIHMRYPKISFNTSHPSEETLTIFPFNQKKLKVFVKIFVLPVQKTEIIKIQKPGKINPGQYEIDEFLKFKGQLQSLYVVNRSDKINILPRLTYQSIDMNTVSGCPHFIYKSEFAFCCSNLETIYKDRINNKKYTFYKRKDYNDKSVIIGLAWQELKPGLRLFLIASSYEDNIFLIFYKVLSDLSTKEVLAWTELFTKIVMPPESIKIFDISQVPIKFAHKINRHSDRYQGIFYLTTNSLFLSYGYNTINNKLVVNRLNQAGTEMFAFGEYSGFIDTSVVSFSDFIPNIYESMVFFVLHGNIRAKQFGLNHRIKPSSAIIGNQRFDILKDVRMISCKDVSFLAQSKMFMVRCLVVCDYLDAFVYTFRVDLKSTAECEITGLGERGELVDLGRKASLEAEYKDYGVRAEDFTGFGNLGPERLADSDKGRVCAAGPELEKIDHYFIPRGYRAQKIIQGRNYFVIFCSNREAHTGELMIFKKNRNLGTNNTTPYVWASLYIPYETSVNFFFKYDHGNGKEGLVLHENIGALIFYDLQTMKLEVKEGSLAVERLGIKVMNFGEEIADKSSLFNLSYRINDLGTEKLEHIQQIHLCLMVIVYLCAVIGLVIIGRLIFALVTRNFGEKVGYEVNRRSYTMRISYISGSHLILDQMKDPDVLMFETEDELEEMLEEEFESRME